MSTDTRPTGDFDTDTRVATWGMVGLLAAVHASAFGDRFLTALVAAPLTRDLHLGDAQFGLIQGACFVALYLVATPIFGRLADRFSPRLVILAGLCIWTAATFALAFAHSFTDVALSRLALGAGEAALTPAALSLIAARAGPARTGRALSVFTSGSTLGKGLALLVGGALLGELARRLPHGGAAPWRVLIQLAVIPNLLLAIALLFTRDDSSAPRSRPPISQVAEHLRRHARDYLRLTMASGAVVVLSQTLAAWTPLFYGRAFGLTPATAGMLTGAALIVFAPAGSLLGGVLLDHLGRRGLGDLPLRLLAAALGVTAIAAIVMLAAPHPAASVAGYAVILVCLGAAAPASLVQLKLLSPAHMRGSLASIYLAVVTLIGFGIGPPVVGVMSERLFGPGRHLGPALLVFVAAGCAVGLAGFAIPTGRRAGSSIETQAA